MSEQNRKAGGTAVRGKWNAFVTWAKTSPLREWLLSAILLAAAFFVLLYYITGPAIAYFHADCTDSLLWSQVMVETGEVLSEEFHYAAILPFGSPLWMVPVLRIFGYTMTAQTVSMAIFAVLFVLAAFSLFRAMKWGGVASSGGALLLSLLLSGSVKLREIMWEHVIYYSLGLWLFMLLLNLCLRLFDYMKRRAEGEKGRGFSICFGLLAGALLLLCIGCGIDGFQVLVLSVLPVMGGCVAMAFLDGKSRFRSHTVLGKYLLAGIMAVGMVAGLRWLSILTKGGAITAGYETAYSNWESISKWWEHIEGFLISYLTLFGVNVQGGDPLFSVSSAFILVKLIVAVVLLVCPSLLLLRYRRLERESAKLVAWSHCFLAVVLLLGYVCGSLSAANWRLTPLLGSNIIATLLYFRELWDDKELGRRMAVVLVSLLVITAAFHADTILQLPNDAGDNQKYITVTEMLADKGYTKGYATFWNAGNSTLLSNGAVNVVSIEADDKGVRKYLYQTNDRWFEDEEGRDAYFLLLTEREYEKVAGSEYWQELHATHRLLDEWQHEEFHILVFSGNPIL